MGGSEPARFRHAPRAQPARAIVLAAVLALLFTPHASALAGVSVDTGAAPEAAPEERAPAMLAPPCWDVSVLTAFTPVDGLPEPVKVHLVVPPPPECGSPGGLDALAAFTETGGSGAFTFDHPGLAPLLNPPGGAPGMMGGAMGPAGAPVAVHVAWHATWTGTCADARLTVVARAAGGEESAALANVTRDDVLGDACALLAQASAPHVDIAPHVDAVLAIAHAVGRALHDAAPDVALSLDPAFAALAQATPPPVVPADAEAGVDVTPPQDARPDTAGAAAAAADPATGALAASAAVTAGTPLADAESDASGAVPALDARPQSARARGADVPNLLPRDAAPALARLPVHAPPALVPTPRIEPGTPAPGSDATPERAPDAGTTQAAQGVRATPVPANGVGLVLTVTAAGLVVGALATLACLALYQRIARPTALKHPARSALYDALHAGGGRATVGALAEAVGLERKTAEYHLVYLARLRLVHEERPPEGPRVFTLPGSAPRDTPDRASLSARILAHVRAEPGVTVRALADALGATRPRVERRVKDLVIAGALESRVTGGRRCLHPGAGVSDKA